MLPLDEAHERAKAFTGEIVTSQEVLTEHLNFFAAGSKHLRLTANLTVNAILQGSAVRVIPQSDSSFRNGPDLYRARPGQGL